MDNIRVDYLSKGHYSRIRVTNTETGQSEVGETFGSRSKLERDLIEKLLIPQPINP